MIESATVPAPPESLLSPNPVRWLSIFGPGAIMASLTIGTGELIFSSRGGAIFGYRILFLFVVISLLKWVLVYSTARHMVLTGAHPFQRWLALPGPRGWLPAVMFVFAAICFPIWVSFHASVLGDLFAGLTGTKHLLNGATIHIWGAGILTVVVVLSLSGGYSALERIQLMLVSAMLIAVLISLVLLKPDWGQMLLGSVLPQTLEYPEWLMIAPNQLARNIAATPVWVEASLYVGVIGGASYDYLAYASFLRSKGWGVAGIEMTGTTLSGSRVSEFTQDGFHSPKNETLVAARRWLRAPMIDCTISFLVVFVFSAVFVASGAVVLAPQRQIPGDGSFLEHQAQFVTELHPWLYPLYIIGTILTMLGTLYGTLEVAPPILTETIRLWRPPMQSQFSGVASKDNWPQRRTAILWSGVGALAVLMVSFIYQLQSGQDRPPGLTNLLTPASLFTGVVSCGVICLLNPWMDRVLPKQFRLPMVLRLANWFAGIVFLLVGLRAYWQLGGFKAILLLGGTVGVGCVAAILAERSQRCLR